MKATNILYSGLAVMLLAGARPSARAADPAATGEPPPGFTALFNGRDLAGWRGGDTFDHRKLLAMPAAEREAQIARWTAQMKGHWLAENGELVNDGQGAYATTEKDYGDFELLVEYKTVPKADSGIYLRGCPRSRSGTTPRRRNSHSVPTKARAVYGTTAPARPAKTRWCWPTSRLANGIRFGSSWLAPG
jgi:hypothetical protein